MTTPTNDDDGTAQSDLSDDDFIRQMIQEKLAKLTPEEGRKWRERLLAFLTQEMIVDRTPEGDGERE